MKANEYILKKLEKYGIRKNNYYDANTEVDGLYYDLENAIRRWSEKNGYLFQGFFYDCGKGFQTNIINSLPCSPSEYYSYITDKGLTTTSGWYVHMINKDINTDLKAYLENFIEISGEVCFANFEDQQLHYRKSCYGVVMEGTPTHSFPFDCYSLIDPKNGLRYATKEEESTWREEHWLIPQKSNIKALIYNDKTEIEITKIANIIKVDTMHLNCVHIEKVA